MHSERLVFLEECSQCLVEKIQPREEKCPMSFVFVLIVQLDELRGFPSVMVTTKLTVAWKHLLRRLAVTGYPI